ncbi:hypothetical protein [Burkholderia ubonensis]|uniref:hypothetical protein n=1 Tax=Burkholderia ubonensis TaxID=101571 RepID=UPI000757116E|nr:hypothetical protein [Burkholderia ubonensis]KWK75752.1 hypothetical protein WM15_29585 [Burkholderia ubonensis]
MNDQQQSRADALTDAQLEAAAIAMHDVRRDLAKGIGDLSFDMEFSALPDEIKDVDRALARAALLAASPLEQPAAAPIARIHVCGDEIALSATSDQRAVLMTMHDAPIYAESPAVTSANETGAEGAVERFIVISHGESDIPVAKIVARRADVLDAVLSMIYGGPCPDDAMRDEYASMLGDWDGDHWNVTFEIGGIDVWRVSLSRSPAMAAPAPADERAAFEAWGNETFNYGFRPDTWCDGSEVIEPQYQHEGTQMAWEGWQARAAASPAAEAVAQWQTKLRDPILPECDVWINVSEEGAKTAREKYAHVYEVRALYAAPQPAQADASRTIPDECVASGASCSYAPEGRHGEMQCRYCGKAPADALDEEQRDALNEAICWANDDGLPGTAGQLRSILALHAQADAPAEAREPLAWVTPEGDRSITHAQKQGMLRDGGAGATSVRPYSIPCYAGRAPADAGEAREPHSDDVAVDSFAAVMKHKLALARDKGRGGWETCSPVDLSRMLREHVAKGDPRDVANFCMMLWHHDSPIVIAPPTARVTSLTNEQIAATARQHATSFVDGDDAITDLFFEGDSYLEFARDLLNGADHA